MKKVAIYVRLSEEDRDKKHKTDDSESIQNQKSMLISYALDKGWEIFNIYSDEDYSGIDKNRPEFIKMLGDCKDGKIDIVLCKSQSRFSRELETIEHYIHDKFLEWGIRFVSIVDNADTEIAGNKKARQINGLINEWYLEDLSDNIKKTLKHKKEKGEFTGSFAPYGYIKDPDNKSHLLIDDVSANTVRLIFEMYKNGSGYYSIAKHLNSLNIPSPSEYKRQNGSKFACCHATDKTKWSTDTICLILQNETYIGSLVQGRKTNVSYKNKKSVSIPKKDWIVVKNCHEPIIDMETWNIVSSLFKKRTRQQKTGKIQIFSQKVYCMECGKVFSKNVGYSGKNKYDYLNCKTTKRTGSCQNKHLLRLDYLEELVIGEINKLIKNLKDVSLIEFELSKYEQNNSSLAKKQISFEKEKELLEKQIKDKQGFYKILYEDKLKEIISEDEFLMLRDDFHAELAILKERLLLVNEELAKETTKSNKNISAKELIKKYSKIKKLDRIIVEEFIGKIYIGTKDEVTKEREIHIEWNF